FSTPPLLVLFLLLLFLMLPPPPWSTLFPYTTLFRSLALGTCVALFDGIIVLTATFVFSIEQGLYALIGLVVTSRTIDLVQVGLKDRKSTRLNSSHVSISYAVFCLKKKKKFYYVIWLH